MQIIENTAAQPADDKLTKLKGDIEAVSIHFRNEDLPETITRIPASHQDNLLQGSRQHQIVDAHSFDDDEGGVKDDSGFQKGLSRTKGSLQLHAINNDGNDDEDEIVNHEIPQ